MTYEYYVLAAFVGLCIGMIIMAVIADRANKAETENLRQQINTDSRNYLRCVSQMQNEIDDLNGKLNMEQHVVSALKIENEELRGRLERQQGNDNHTITGEARND